MLMFANDDDNDDDDDDDDDQTPEKQDDQVNKYFWGELLGPTKSTIVKSFVESCTDESN